MASRAFQTRFEDLPPVLRVFPLAGALLLPEGRLPLNIFEPRYLALVEDSLAQGRLFGMIQPSGPARDGAEPPLYETGCAGRIVSFSETGDGRFLITLGGVCRFRMEAELEGARGYRRVAADWKPFIADLDPPGEIKLDRKRLLAALRTFLKLHEMEVDWEAVEGSKDAVLSIALPMSCPFEPREKQALLECPDAEARGSMLIALLEMGVAERRGGSGQVQQ